MRTSGKSPSNHELLADLHDPTGSLRHAIPDVWAGFTSLHKAAVADGAVPARLKEAAASSSRRPAPRAAPSGASDGLNR